ncbi:hypothetical protein QTP88_004091 [Uroleucon formosanum]
MYVRAKTFVHRNTESDFRKLTSVHSFGSSPAAATAAADTLQPWSLERKALLENDFRIELNRRRSRRPRHFLLGISRGFTGIDWVTCFVRIFGSLKRALWKSGQSPWDTELVSLFVYLGGCGENNVDVTLW